MRQWRILHSESSMGWGGQEVRVLVELEWMRAHGHWVALAAHPESQVAKRAQAVGIPFFALRTHKALLPFEIMRLAGWLYANQVDLVNTHSSNDGWLAGIAAQLAGKPLIRSRHIEVDYPNKFWSRIAFHALPQHVITTSQVIANRLVEELSVLPGNVTCISTGIDLTKFNPAIKGNLRDELGIAKDVALVGMISVLRSWKGHATFLDAAALLLKSAKQPIHFVIAGDGPGRQELTDKIAQEPWKDRVTLLGHRADVPNVLASLDVLVLPSYAHEGIPQIILQAQAMARAVVGTTIGGIPEVVEDGVTGLLIPPRNPEALAEKVGALLDDPALRARLGQAARANIEKQHGVDAMGERLLALYDKVSPPPSQLDAIIRRGKIIRSAVIWALILFVAIFVAPYTFALFKEKWIVSRVVANAQSIRFEHYRNSFDTLQKEEIIATRDLAPADFHLVSDAFPIGLDAGFPGIIAMCLFNPHHRIMITDASGKVTTIEVCFECDHFAINHAGQTSGDIVDTPFIWKKSLRRLFADEGMLDSTGGSQPMRLSAPDSEVNQTSPVQH